MRVGIIGAGVSGLVSARVFRDVGLDVVAFESRPDIGGVWSATRRYPGIGLQNDKYSYAFSDVPMPADYPTYPNGEQVRDYLTEYAHRHHLEECLRLDTTVLHASRATGSGWLVEARGPEGTVVEEFDWLIMANGICSLPHVPDLPGRNDFERAGGVVVSPSDLSDGASFRDRDLVVLGYGKSAADAATAAVGLARSVHVVARQVLWKLPLRTGRLTFQRLVLSRLGEHLIWAPRRRTRAARLALKGFGPLRRWLLRRVEHAIRVHSELERRALSPTMSLYNLTHLETPGFFEAIDDGRISVHRDQAITELGADGDRPTVVLSDGARLPADVVVAATGYDQDLAFLDETVRQELLNETGDLVLLRHTLPPYASRIAFVGWLNSFRSPLNAEVQALWIAAVMHGLVTLPAPDAPGRRDVFYLLRHERAAARRAHQFSHGGTIPDLDCWIAEAGLRIPWHVRLRELLGPVDPSSYAGLLPQLQARIAAASRAGPGTDQREASADRAARAAARTGAGTTDDSATR